MENGYRVHREPNKGWFVTYYEAGKPPCELVGKEGTAKSEEEAQEVIKDHIRAREDTAKYGDKWFDSKGNEMKSFD